LLFAHRLVANGIGGRTVLQLADNMTVDEFIDWQAYYTIEPFGTENLNAARQLHLLYQINSRKGASIPSVESMTLGDRPKPPVSAEEVAAKLGQLRP